MELKQRRVVRISTRILFGLTVAGACAFFVLNTGAGVKLHAAFNSSTSTEKLSVLAGGEWVHVATYCPYSTATYNRSDMLGLSGKYSNYIGSESKAAITYKDKSGGVYLVKFDRTSDFDPCKAN